MTVRRTDEWYWNGTREIGKKKLKLIKGWNKRYEERTADFFSHE
jgi:hypothetical protein